MKFFFIYNTVAGLRSYRLDQPTITVGSLPSNHLVLAGKNVEPIHGLVERQTDGNWRITDLGSEAGISINGKKIDVETELHPRDKIQFGNVELHFEQELPTDEKLIVGAARGKVINDSTPTKTKKSQAAVSTPQPSSLVPKDQLFNVDKVGEKSSGKTLEVVACWGDRVLEIEHYHPKKKGSKKRSVATIGHFGVADFIAAGPKNIKLFTIAKATTSGFTLKLVKGMKARLRRAGKIKNVEKAGNFKLSSRDIADVEYGPVRYFFLYVTLPKLKLPKQSPRDPLLLAMIWAGMLFFFMAAGTIILRPAPEMDAHKKDDIWSVVTVSKDVSTPKKEKEEKKPEIVIKPVKKENQKPVVPQVKPKPVPIKPAQKAVEKVKPQKITRPTPNRKLNKIAPAPKTVVSKPKTPPKSVVGSAAVGGKKADGTVSGGSPKKNLKGVGAKGVAGGGNGSKGGVRKGKGKNSVAGVEGVSNKQASGVNLSKLGQSAGKIFNKAGAGAIRTNFQSSGGGLGGGSGSGERTRGLGGSLAAGSALGLEGTSGQMNKFGSGGGGILTGAKGVGGFSASGTGGGRSKVQINVSSDGAPGVSGGLNSGVVTKVIRANHNAIRHCYEKQLQRNPNARGRIKARFVIGANGRVVSVTKIQDTVGSSELIGCIFQKVRTWKFPKPAGGQKVTVTYPWAFNPV
ncbi:MAG: AgmX/PglI C-terminal domain-containing protein [Proteobacteria bacterium]|nr:AgmX/PglI C-terminal domain-containing protein [Pseudomonadota bacterium]